MNKRQKLMLLCCALLACAVIVSCSTAKKVTSIVIHSSEPKKKIGFIGMANKTEYAVEDYAQSISDILYDRLQKSGDLLVISSEELKSGGFNPPISRDLTELEPFMPQAKEMGLNALVKGDISELELSNELRGIYGFRKEKRALKIILRAQLIDVESHTILYEGYKRADVVLELQEGSTLKDYLAQNDKIPLQFVTDAVKEMGGDMVDILDDQPWKSYITKLEPGKVVFPAGRDAGVEVGSVMHVWSQGKTIQNFAGQSFIMPGERIGSIRCESVEDHKTVSQIIEGKDFQLGDIVSVND